MHRDDFSRRITDELVRNAGPEVLKRWLSKSPDGRAEASVDELTVDEVTQRRAVHLLRRASDPSAVDAPRTPESLVTRCDAAALLQMDPRTFDRRVRPHVPDHGLGGPPKFKVSEILAYVTAAASKPTAPNAKPKRPKQSRRARRVHRWRVLGRVRAATRIVNDFTDAIDRQTKSLYTLTDAHERAVGSAGARVEARGTVSPFIQSDRGRSILKEIDGDD